MCKNFQYLSPRVPRIKSTFAFSLFVPVDQKKNTELSAEYSIMPRKAHEGMSKSSY